ncbi:MAG: glucosidase [Acidobacteriales bacterium]|nr:glucosidase [Terriglobales bacterium]
MTQEETRLAENREHKKYWHRWGPYLAERAWGTVREDYSANGDAWNYLTHDQARSRAYRWSEDGLGGICDRHQLICFAVALWNEQDPILKERLFGLTGTEGNHGEDVKEYYYYLDNTPTHSYMKYLYKYPQKAFPYDWLLAENRKRGKFDPEFELMDTGIFDENRYFDVQVEYAKADCEDICIRITAWNRGPDTARLRLLPTVWFRNTWSWDTNPPERPELCAAAGAIALSEPKYGQRWLYYEGTPELLFTENETNAERLFKAPNARPWVKDGIHEYLVKGRKDAVAPQLMGTKAALHYSLEIPAGGVETIRLRLSDKDFRAKPDSAFADFGSTFDTRKQEADEFYEPIIPSHLSDDAKNVMRQAFAGMLWSKQYYHYVVQRWLEGDPTYPPPPPERAEGRNHNWQHVYCADVLSMPDKWEYPWFAAWDLAFHCIPLALVDPDYAKDQLVLLLREWYMHPNGRIPAYEWAFGDVNPPVHAWAAWRVYKIDKKRKGVGDHAFLEKVFHKLLLNFTWWVNRKDQDGMNIFQGGFLGLDNIGLFDRSSPLPTGGYIEQSDGTSWMAMFTLNLLAIAIELASVDPAYEDVASKFWEHFIYIAHAMSHRGDGDPETPDMGLWDDRDGFFYDVLKLPDGKKYPMRIRSMVGLIPLFAVETLDPVVLERMPGFKRRFQWFLENRPKLVANVACMRTKGMGERRLLSICNGDQLRRVLRYMLDENEFLSPYGLRSVSRYHKDHPFEVFFDNKEYRVDYEPAESTTGLFGGNSNWRGPVWFPLNYLIIESLQRLHHFWGHDFQVEFPTGSGKWMNLWDVAATLSQRMTSVFLRDDNGRRACLSRVEKMQSDPHWRDLMLFHEYFNGDDGAGLGAEHQTGWTGLVTKMLQQSGEKRLRTPAGAAGTD